ncbi:STAS domain-containing protein [Saccharomonospora glauca]|jgi:anti-sigma B factor antagonist|uniref:Anti-anti-sigma regulatory factor (Antagonist of anti-sigma factor) n=1 Tax=Saccharomonospora glauca K62 TaxID=928724 RepID=I1D4S3_9PSEU|nr:STAS domain-containing protein [Saccharomonospora glauca]EIE99947.1 anti-anti-sigma regulatory factor (antagonist of anti-sigma factor) [Saccharomonospora glauca K62]
MVCTKDDVEVRVDRPVVGLVVVRVIGEVDLLGAPILRRRVEAALPGARALVVDLSDTTFFGAAGLSVLVHTSALAERFRVRWALVCPSVILRLVRITNLDRELPVCRDFGEAVLAATAPSAAFS